MELFKTALFFSCLFAMIPWVRFVFISIKFDRNVVIKGHRGITDRDRISLAFCPSRFAEERNDEMSQSEIILITDWYSREIKTACRNSIIILAVWFCAMLIGT